MPITVTCSLYLKQHRQMVLFGESVRMLVVDLLSDVISINKHDVEYGGRFKTYKISCPFCQFRVTSSACSLQKVSILEV